MIHTPSQMKTETRENMRGGAGSVTIQHLFARDEMTANSRLCARLIIPPDAGIGSHEHATEDEVYVVVKGTGLLDDGTTKTRVNVGDAILTGNGESHAVANDGDEDLEIIAFIMCY